MKRGHRRVGVVLLATLLLLGPRLAIPEQSLAAGLRFAAPPDGATVEPGQTVTVIVEPLPGVTPAFVGLLSPLIAELREEPPFAFAVTIPSDAPLGPHTITADGLDVKEQPLEAKLRLQIETMTPVTSIQVRSTTIGQPASVDLIAGVLSQRVRVIGTFADGKILDISKSREIQYVSNNSQVATVTPDGLAEAVDPGTTTITVTYKGKTLTLPVTVDFQKLTVPLDIKPGDPRNTINLDSGGPVRVAILSTDVFAASTVNPPTVQFGPGGATPDLEHVRTRDVNRDGQDDLVLRFRIQETGIRCGEITATLTGLTVLGDRIRGNDSIRVVGKACR